MPTLAGEADVTGNERSETSPLLSPSSDSTAPSNSHPSGANCPTRSSLYPYATILVGLFSLVADLGGALVETPEIRLLEMATCRDYYREHDPSVIGPPPLSYVDEELCKVIAIQSRLAYIRATKFFIGLVPGLVLTFFYGRLSDKIGRKPVLLLGMTGQILAYFWVLIVCYFHQIFSTNAVLLSPAFLVIGGGVRVVTAVMNTVVIDVTPAEMRTTVFYLIGAAVLITDIIALPIGSWLLSKDLWLPWKFSAPIILMAFPIIIAMPETMRVFQNDTAPEDSRAEEEHEPRWKLDKTFGSLLNRAIAFLVERANTVAISKKGLFTQYASKVLNWPIANVGYILSIQAIVTFAILLGLAGMTRLMNARGITSSLSIDVWVARASALLTVAADILIGLGTTAPQLIAGKLLSAASTPSTQAVQAIVASYASESVTGQLYASLAFVELLGGLGGSFAFAALFDAGLGMENRRGIGLPFWIAAAVSSVSFFLSLNLS